jgi:hypothetical protein
MNSKLSLEGVLFLKLRSSMKHFIFSHYLVIKEKSLAVDDIPVKQNLLL